MAKKQLVDRLDKTINIYDFDALVVNIIALLQEKVKKHGDGCRMEIEYGYDGECDVLLSYNRLETDGELEKRLAKARKKRDAQQVEREKREAHERKEFERLSKKYGAK